MFQRIRCMSFIIFYSDYVDSSLTLHYELRIYSVQHHVVMESVYVM